jgi:hypothetical protein
LVCRCAAGPVRRQGDWRAHQPRHEAGVIHVPTMVWHCQLHPTASLPAVLAMLSSTPSQPALCLRCPVNAQHAAEFAVSSPPGARCLSPGSFMPARALRRCGAGYTPTRRP